MFHQRLLTFSSSLVCKVQQPGVLSSLLAHARLHSQTSTNSILFKLNSRAIQLELRRGKRAAAVNFGVLMVPQQEAWILERFGKFHKSLEPGLNFAIPFIDRVSYIQVLKEIVINIPQQSAITVDNVLLDIDGVLYMMIRDPYKASYGVENAEFAITQLAQTTMRSEIGQISLDTVFREREVLNAAIVAAINKAAEAWGIVCYRYEIRDVHVPSRIQEAMQLQVEAERKKRAAILESEGTRDAEVNVAEGKKRSRILASEAQRQEQINRAEGEASAIIAVANAQANSVKVIGGALGDKAGMDALSYKVAEQYITAFGHLARTANTVLLPANAGDVSSMVTQAMTLYRQLSAGAAQSSESEQARSLNSSLNSSRGDSANPPPAGDVKQ